jgi:hypothetical protein
MESRRRRRRKEEENEFIGAAEGEQEVVIASNNNKTNDVEVLTTTHSKELVVEYGCRAMGRLLLVMDSNTLFLSADNDKPLFGSGIFNFAGGGVVHIQPRGTLCHLFPIILSLLIWN